MLYLYLDESGDLGFDFVNKKPSKFFTISILVIRGAKKRRQIAKSVERTIRKKLNPKSKRRRMVQELKGVSTTLTIKEYLYRRIKKIDFSIYSITLNKKRAYSYLIKDKSRIYNWVARILLDKVNFSDAQNRVVLTVDKSKSKPQIKEFNDYIYNQLEAKIDPKVSLNIEHADSCADKCLNVADLFSWGVFRKHERKDSIWYDLFAEKVKFDQIYLPQNKK
jgi:hypothetical protein